MKISEEAFKYLYIQRGEVSGAYAQGFEAWKDAYEASLDSIMANILPVLPPVGQGVDVLDIGGGLGGIGIKLKQHYKMLNYEIIDGMMDEPEVIAHNETFSNHIVARKFQEANGLYGGVFHSTAVGSAVLGEFDVILSFAAWCFHIAPEYYLNRIRAARRHDTVMILDLRKDKTRWREMLVYAFGEPDQVLEEGKKHVRLAWT